MVLISVLTVFMFAMLMMRHTQGTWYDRWDPYDDKHIPGDRDQRKRWRKK